MFRIDFRCIPWRTDEQWLAVRNKRGKRPMRAITAVLGALLVLGPVSVRADEYQVTVASGALSGLASRDGLVRSFKGIPYAAPPVGALRWRPPQAVTAWQGTREANRFASICPQPSPIPGGFYQREYFQTAEAQSEDCLYLNVWTATTAGADPRPVMVFFHSGGNFAWSGSMPVYDGTHLARKGAVVVTINYRLGVFGFLAHPELDTESPNHVSGNYGLLDQQAALRWVKANIAAFGGDPERITIFGQSAGATDVGYAMASQLTKAVRSWLPNLVRLRSRRFGTCRPRRSWRMLAASSRPTGLARSSMAGCCRAVCPRLSRRDSRTAQSYCSAPSPTRARNCCLRPSPRLWARRSNSGSERRQTPSRLCIPEPTPIQPRQRRTRSIAITSPRWHGSRRVCSHGRDTPRGSTASTGQRQAQIPPTSEPITAQSWSTCS